MSVAQGALSHLKVLDMSRVLAGPWASQTLGDMGAEIWKIERPGSGDETRSWGPPFVQEPDGDVPGISAYFANVNRNKKSIALDFTSEEGARLIHQLAGEADILIENFKVGGLAKYGLDYASLSKDYPHLIYCSVTGFGQDGPDASRAGYDFMIQGMSGLMSVTGEPKDAGGMPVKAGVALIDILTGLNASVAILAAVEHRNKTGQGQHIDLSLFDVGVASLANQALNFLVSDVPPQRMGNAHPNIVPYQAFETADGHIILAVGNDGQFQRFCAVAGQPELAEDSRFSTNINRVISRDILVPLLEPLLRQDTTDNWLTRLAAVSVPAGPVNDLARVFDEPQARHRGLARIAAAEDGSKPLAPVRNTGINASSGAVFGRTYKTCFANCFGASR
jgi:crotonobetainyl-CoA:carnitine CoA-transferase CaiB-like acyl-CoA transferase